MSNEMTVFVVDDDPGVRHSMRWLLASEGLKVETYVSGADFLRALKPEQAGCVVLDLYMPQMDGLEVQRRIRAAGSTLPILFVTGHGDVSTCAEAMKAGAVDFLEKPVDDELLLTLVRRLLEADRKQRSFQVSKREIRLRLDRLTSRESEVMEHLYAGKTPKSIAFRLGVSVQTVAKHRARVLRKLRVGGEAELARLLDSYRIE